MPRASWKGFLRLSLVSCPIYLSPATTRTKSIRLHQVWQPKAARGAPIEDEEEEERQPYQDAGRSYSDDIRGDARAEPSAPARIALLPHDPQTGAEIEREEVVKGYEYERGQFVTFSAEELKALDVESSKIIDLETFAPGCAFSSGASIAGIGSRRDPAEMAERHGADTTVPDWQARLVCGACGSRHVDMVVDGTERRE